MLSLWNVQSSTCHGSRNALLPFSGCSLLKSKVPGLTSHTLHSVDISLYPSGSMRSSLIVVVPLGTIVISPHVELLSVSTVSDCVNTLP